MRLKLMTSDKRRSCESGNARDRSIRKSPALRIVLNLALDRRRKITPLPIDDAVEIRSDDPEPLTMMIENEDRQEVDAAMAALPERQRVAIALFHMEGLSVREAAQSMNVTEKALESLLVRARSAIKKHVETRDRINRRFA